MIEGYTNTRFRADKLRLIEQANTVIRKIRSQGYTLTLRQLYYQLVGAGIIENTLREYKRLGDYLNDARMAGRVDWDAIEDRTRNLDAIQHWRDPREILEACAESYRIEKWSGQEFYVEVWVEKDALAGIVAKACQPLDVAFLACRGYPSASEVYTAGKRMARAKSEHRHPIIIHLGDHDPSGIDMTRDIQARVSMLARTPVTVRRIALTMEQISEHNAPPNPAKAKDTRFKAYRANYGAESWELDALPVQYLDQLITAAVLEYRDDELWNQALLQEEKERRVLRLAVDNWQEITAEFCR